jgi:prepilin-type N-terminal cleavage/methylation domain-containing protein
VRGASKGAIVMHYPKKGFTLIELLVVIAIIAILAAILFPVFAQAKMAAKKTNDLSNIKQLSLGIVMYENDYDDRFPMVGYFDVPGNWSTHHLWTKDTQPYVKSLQLLRDPVEPDHLWSDAWSKPDPSLEYRYPTYGFNADYLNYAGNSSCSLIMYNGWYWGPPIASTSMDEPADTVMLSATYLNMYNSTEYVDSPALATDPNVCDVWGDGWGGNDGLPGVVSTTFSGHNSPRYNSGMDTSFTDGHAKYLKIGQLAAGTNWNPAVTTQRNQVFLTDASKYLWSTSKTNG